MSLITVFIGKGFFVFDGWKKRVYTTEGIYRGKSLIRRLYGRKSIGLKGKNEYLEIKEAFWKKKKKQLDREI